jgi:hypothetical protein
LLAAAVCAAPQLLLAAKVQLEQVVSHKLEEATAARDHAGVLRYVLLHRPLGLAAQGLSKYVRYLCITLGSQGRELYDALSEALDKGAPVGPPAKGNPPPIDFVSALTGLFKAVAVAVEQDEEVSSAGMCGADSQVNACRKGVGDACKQPA